MSRVEIHTVHLKFKICSEVLGMEQRQEEGNMDSALRARSASTNMAGAL